MTPIKELLKSPIASSILAITTIAVSVVLYLASRKRKALSFEILRNDELIKVDHGFAHRVAVTVDGVPATGVTLVIIDIQNTGNEPIRRDDFEKPLQFTFNGLTKVISSRILRSEPSDLGAEVMIQSNKLTLVPQLLNPGDKVSVEALLSQKATAISHSGRVVGISEIHGSLNTGKSVNRNELISILLGSGGVGLAVLSTVPGMLLLEVIPMIILGTLTGVGFRSTISSLMGRKKLKSR